MGRLGSALRGFGGFWWDFIVGDDWRIAAGILAALAITAILAAQQLAGWWFLPLAVLTLLGISLASAVRSVRRV